jgi:hypothetical protein
MIFSTVGIRGNFLRIILAAGGAFNLFAQSTQVRGTVKDAGTQAAVAGATVTLLSRPELTATTDADGAFSITLEEPTAIGPGAKASASMSLRGGELSFSTGKDGARVRVTLHDLRGRLVATLQDSRLPQGEYSLSAVPAGLRPGLFLVRATVGNQARSFKLSTLGCPASASTLKVKTPSRAARAKAAAGGVDFLVVVKDGYLKKHHEVMAYADAQAVVLETSKPAVANLALFTDSAYSQIDWANAAIYSWEQTAVLTVDSTGKGVNGSLVSMNVASAEFSTWNGWAFHVAKLANGTQPTADLTPYAAGSLHLAVKGNAASIGVMISSPNQGPGSAPLVDLAAKGYLPDSLWHEITIPMTEFGGTLNLNDVFVYCGFVSPGVQFGAFDATATYTVDDVYFTPAK